MWNGGPPIVWNQVLQRGLNRPLTKIMGESRAPSSCDHGDRENLTTLGLWATLLTVGLGVAPVHLPPKHCNCTIHSAGGSDELYYEYIIYIKQKEIEGGKEGFPPLNSNKHNSLQR